MIYGDVVSAAIKEGVGLVKFSNPAAAQKALGKVAIIFFCPILGAASFCQLGILST
jgi:hypothetical protein